MRLTARWYNILFTRYGDMLSYRHLAVNYLNSVLDDYISLGLLDREFEKQILIRKNFQYEQRLSEVLVFDYLRNNGFSLSSGNYGPDFKAVKNGTTYWFEVITPAPTYQIHDYVNDPKWMLNPNPDLTILNRRHTLLKISGAVRNKNLVFQNYIDKGLIGEDDICVIVINDSLLQPANMPMYGLTEHHVKGDSSQPIIAEALLGLGHQVWRQNEEGRMTIATTIRDKIDNSNNKPVPLNFFSHGGYENISAVLCMTLREDSGFCKAIGHLNHPRRACVVLNDKSRKPILEKFINAYYLNSNVAAELCSPKESNIASVVHTIHGQKLNFIMYMHKKFPELVENEYSIWDFIYNPTEDFSGV